MSNVISVKNLSKTFKVKLKEKGFKVLKKKKFKNPNPEHYPKVKFDKYKLEFDSKHYLGYLIEKKERK